MENIYNDKPAAEETDNITATARSPFQRDEHEKVKEEVTADSSSVSFSSLVDLTNPMIRDMIRQRVTMKRQSLALTDPEQSFLDHVLEYGDHDELMALDANLENSAVFFEQEQQQQQQQQDDWKEDNHDAVTINVASVPNQRKGSTTNIMGSTKRQEYLASRRNTCNGSTSRWKYTTLQIMATRRFGAIHGSLNRATDTKEEATKTDEAIWKKQGSDTFGRKISSIASVPESLLSISEDEAESGDFKEEDEEGSAKKDPPQEEKKSDEDDDEKDVALHKIPPPFPLPHKNGSVATNASRSFRPELIKLASKSMYHGEGFEVGNEDSFELYSPENNYMEHYDPWIYETLDEQGHERLDVHILGTSHDDTTAQPHVLSPILMHSLQPHLPCSQRGQSFWLKYSLVRDGASIISFLQHLRGTQHTLLACETVDGEVFGFYGSEPWVAQPSYFGTGESFVWKMKNSRILDNGEQYHKGSLTEQARREAEIQVYPAANHSENRFFQLCQKDKIGIGGGVCATPQDFGKGDSPDMYQPENIGFALVFDDGTLLHGSSSACLTFESPPLSKHHADGSLMEFVNVEVWGLTPCLTVEEAQMMEHRHLFLRRHTTCNF